MALRIVAVLVVVLLAIGWLIISVPSHEVDAALDEPYGVASKTPSRPPLPTDVSLNGDSSTQNVVNEYAWATFLSLMWPVPDSTNTVVWETWKEQYEVYPQDGSQPAPWGTPQPIPSACTASSEKYLFRDEKTDDVLDAVNQAVKADGTLPGTLTDQNGNVVYYEIRLNQTVFDYIVDNGLYNGEIQAQADAVSFPNGSIIIKAAWRTLTEAEQPVIGNRFVTRDACVCPTPETCGQSSMALVGFHVMHKTPSAPQWLWSTFEHLANVSSTHGMSASFNNPECTGAYCTPNSQTPTGTPNQITQLLPIPEDLQTLNGIVQQTLVTDGSVLANYQLMSAQWPQPGSGDEPTTVFEVSPTWSANTTMESFAQNTSSCMGCHVMSRSLKPDQFVSADFSFTLNNAQPTPAGAVCGEYDYANSMFCSDEVILFSEEKIASYPVEQQAQITQGHQLVSNTYEMLPQHVGNRLHCSSCHLFAGGEPNASWWVGMGKQAGNKPPVYATSEDLQSRINGCFERSMNGSDLCTPGTDCDNNEAMSAIIAYMDWLTDDFNAQPSCDVSDPTTCPQEGFPALSSAPIGDPHAGERVFNQKCAFCHNAEGQGRYESNTYFRPALWGVDSYNANAGMAKANMLAQFLRWNMPYTSGGLLTDQEAQDIACFIDAQTRPGKTSSGITSDVCEPEAMSQ